MACQSTNEEMTLLDNIEHVTISKSIGYREFNEDYLDSINGATAINGFEDVLKSAKGVKQEIDVTKEKPDYDIMIYYENGDTHLLHLALGSKDQESQFMYMGHEKNVFIVSSEYTNKLRNILDVR
ncbi:hypothetical protein JCM21714_2739 [Gracilibacillus boraciitolerans JCM 21714]|uniref:YhfM-like domain-containing protein n=2 Tax=Gracilibacillus boraciitolerans TaxID=307521 RepID=W4VLJ0_9BACI|nr:hypothetical protein JCM21714_2739 [Gracilibacillus boraciitolerans JCM 21714]